MTEKISSACSRSSCAPVTETPVCGCPSNAGSSEIRPTTSTISFANKLDHFLARWGVNRMGHIIVPGLYRLGVPTPDSPVIVTANYTLSFDAVRSALKGADCYILILDTNGVNVWCAAGKGTFGTDELVRRIDVTGLVSVVNHRVLVLPQLGAPGVSAHEVQRKSGFRVEYGPVRARDLPAFLSTRKATPEMRRVTFPVIDRVVLTPVEFVPAVLPTIIVAVVLYFLAGPVAALAPFAAVLAGTVLFPALLPLLPTKDFSTKGLILGVIVALPFSVTFVSNPVLPSWAISLAALAPLLIMPAVTAYLALNFTGASTFTSRTGVKKEIFRYIPVMVAIAAIGVVCGAILGILHLMRGI